MNKWIVVTGASSGIGKCAARTIIERGSKVVLTSRTVIKLEETVKGYPEEKYVIIPGIYRILIHFMIMRKELKKQLDLYPGLFTVQGYRRQCLSLL